MRTRKTITTARLPRTDQAPAGKAARQADIWIDPAIFDDDVQFIEAHWQRTSISTLDLPLLDLGSGDPLVFVPILEHLEFVYSRQIRALSQTRRVILYRRRESHTATCGLDERVEELLAVLDGLELTCVDLLGHGDAAMVLFAFAIRYPERCRSLTIIAQGADYRIAPHPFIWLLHELFLRLPVERFLPGWFLRRIVINYIAARDRDYYRAPPPTQDRHVYNEAAPPEDKGSGDDAYDEVAGVGTVNHPQVGHVSTSALPRALIESQFRKIQQWPRVYKFSVLPIIHSFDISTQLHALTMPVLLINRRDDVLSPEAKTRWLAEQLPNCAGYHVVDGRERFFMYSQAETVTPIIVEFLQEVNTTSQ